MRLPRDLSGVELARRLGRLGYSITRQTGSHLRLTCPDPPQHHITIPAHDSLSAILQAIATRHGMTRDDVIKKLFV